MLGSSATLAFAKGKAASSASATAKRSSGNEKRKVLVGGFEGAKSESARQAVIAALKDDGGYVVVDSSEVRPGGDEKSYASQSDGAAAVLVGKVKKGKGLTVSVRNGANGALIQDVEIKGESSGRLNRNITATFAVSVSDAISQGKPAPAASEADAKAATPDADADADKEEKPKADEEAPAEAATESSSSGSESASSAGPSPLEITAGLRAVHRSFDYHDTVAQLYNQQSFLLSYELPLAPAAFFDATVYPLAFGSKGVGANIGLTGGYEGTFATKSEYTATTPPAELTTRASQFYAGLRARIPVAAHEFGLVAAYGQQLFHLLGDEKSPLVPDVTYKFIRLSAEAKLHFDDVTVGFHLGTRLVSDEGALKGGFWFPNTKAQSVEAGVLLGYTLLPHLDLVGGVDLTRYALNFNPIPTGADPHYVAGGAVDQFVSGWLGLHYALPNSSHN